MRWRNMWPPAEAHGRNAKTMTQDAGFQRGASRTQPERSGAPGAKPWLLALAVALVASPALAETTLWLVRPLYPGQEALEARTEKALDKLMPGPARKEAVIGVKELGQALAGKHVEELPCFTGDLKCGDPIDPFVAALGFDRVVMIYGGQDEAGYKYRVVAYEPRTAKVTSASATATVLDKALLGAVSKVVPAASTLEVKSTPAGATVSVDGAKVDGVTPLSTQVLPGEHTVRIDLKLHQVVEDTVVVPIRGSASFEKTLSKVAARISVTAQPAGATIALDGQVVGKDRLDRGVEPGRHTLRLTLAEHKDFEQTIEVKPGDQYTLDKTLEPIAPKASTEPVKTIIIVQSPDKPDKAIVVQPPPPPPPPKTPTDLSYEHRQYAQANYELAFVDRALVGTRFNGKTARSEYFGQPGRMLMGANVEFGTFFGKYFGLTVFGASYLTNTTPWSISVGTARGASPELPAGTGEFLDPVRVHVGMLRALQPQLRLCAWRFQFGLQAGLEFRIAHVLEPNTTTPLYPDGFLALELMLAARANVRFNVYEGFYVGLSGNYTWWLYGETTEAGVHSGGAWGLSVGVGYAY